MRTLQAFDLTQVGGGKPGAIEAVIFALSLVVPLSGGIGFSLYGYNQNESIALCGGANALIWASAGVSFGIDGVFMGLIAGAYAGLGLGYGGYKAGDQIKHYL